MILIIGGGLAGLACATKLEEAGADWLLLEAAQLPGGRVATEITPEGYHLDVGFQVLLDSYPTACKLLDLPALKPRYFESGALLVTNGKNEESQWERFLNPLVHPEWALGALLTTAFSWSEKFSIAAHAMVQLLRSDKELLQKEAGHSAMEELRRLGLNDGILERFLRPFFAGVFLDNDLGIDASIFRYDLKKFAFGRVLLPAGGMGAIPEQLASRLPQDRLRYGARVTALHRIDDQFTHIELSDGETIECKELVLATDEATTRSLLGLPSGQHWFGVTTLYFTGEEPLYEGALLVLPEGKEKLVRHFVDLTNIAPEYAPQGKRLLSATLLNPPTADSQALVSMAQAEISAYLPAFANWRFLKKIKIARALPSRHPGYGKELLPVHFASNLSLTGDQVSPASIEAALASGLQTADEVLRAVVR